MKYDIYTLPQITIVGGQSKTIGFNLWTINRDMFDTNGCSGNFAVVDYSDKDGDTVVAKQMTFQSGDNPEIQNVAVVSLTPSDTLNLAGKYVYQVTIKNGDIADIPNQGILYIARNINTSFLDNGG